MTSLQPEISRGAQKNQGNFLCLIEVKEPLNNPGTITF